MNIAYISDVATIGGATESLLDLVQEINKRDNSEVYVLTSKEDCLSERLNECGVPNCAVGHGAVLQAKPHNPLMTIPKYLVRLLNYKLNMRSSCCKATLALKGRNIDIVHTNVERTDLGAMLSHELLVPHVVHLREFPSGHFEFWSYRRNYVEYLNKTTDRFIAVSESVKEAWSSIGLDEDRIDVIYDGVRFDSDKTDSLIREIGSDSKINIAVVGGISRMKGQWQLFEAMGMLPRSVSSKYRVVVLGDGDNGYVSEIKNRASVLGQNNIVFLGNVSDAAKKLYGFQFGFIGSKNEAFGRVTVEYIENGLVPIVSESGANIEIVRRCCSGVSFPYGDVSCLANLLVQIARDPASYVADVNSAEIARDLYSCQKCADNVLALYESLTGRMLSGGVA